MKRTAWLPVFMSVSLILLAQEDRKVFPEKGEAPQEEREFADMQEEKINKQVKNNGEDVLAPKKINPVQKKVLSNGMTVLVRPLHMIPKVSLQLWYNVGSKDEKSGEKGIAHLIEHMIFKGTKKLSESDINVLSHKLSGNINAFTSWDYTGYLFNFPTQNWKETLPIMADCMLNCAFKDDHLNSEMKAVIQELKMYRDNYQMSLLEEMMGSIFVDHPYHYPIIGFKQDLWSVHGKDLKAFYQKHYHPNNATLVIVGDVNPEEVFKLAENHFGKIKANPSYKKQDLYFNQDIVAKSVTLYRDIKQPFEVLVFVVPGIHNKKEHVLEVASFILGSGKSSRLQRKLIDELQLVTSLETAFWDLFDHGLFFVMFEPKDLADIPSIETVIQEELEAIKKDGLSAHELESASKKAQMKLYSILENTEKQAYEIGKHYLATKDENYLFNYLSDSSDVLEKEVVDLITSYLRPAVMHKGLVLPLPEGEKEEWARLQKLSDAEDERILSVRKRETPIEPPLYADTIEVKEPEGFAFPKANTFSLTNGLKVLWHHNDNTPKINIILELKARPYYDAEDLPGLYNFVTAMLSEGTEHYSATELADAIESRGMSFDASPGSITMRMHRDDFEKGLEILEEILSRSTFNKDEIEKVRDQLLADIKNFWDEPSVFAGQLIKEQIYKNHPFRKNILGTEDIVKKVNRKNLVKFYHKYISPHGARLAIVGDLKKYNLQDILEKKLALWHGPEVEDIEFPSLAQVKSYDVNYPINRDQVVLCYAGLSIDRKNPDFDKLLLFDQIFGSGSLGSLHSRLFQLREQSGLFYTINGTTLANSSEQPGLVFVKTIVSLDRLQEAEKAIKGTIEKVADTLKEDEVQEARSAIVNSLVYNFESNNSIAKALLFLDKYEFSSDYFDKRAEALTKIQLKDVQEAVRKVLANNKLVTLRIGRIESTKKKAA